LCGGASQGAFYVAVILFTAFFMLNNVMAVIVAQYADAAKHERDQAARSADDQDKSPGSAVTAPKPSAAAAHPQQRVCDELFGGAVNAAPCGATAHRKPSTALHRAVCNCSTVDRNAAA
jgi:hypothetical protein